jgi:hypothetical protein
LHGIADHLRIGLAKSRLDVTREKLKVRNANVRPGQKLAGKKIAVPFGLANFPFITHGMCEGCILSPLRGWSLVDFVPPLSPEN